MSGAAASGRMGTSSRSAHGGHSTSLLDVAMRAAPIRLQRFAVIVSLATLGALVIHNLYWIVRNQTGPQLIRYKVLPHDIARVAFRAKHPKVSQYAAYYW